MFLVACKIRTKSTKVTATKTPAIVLELVVQLEIEEKGKESQTTSTVWETILMNFSKERFTCEMWLRTHTC